MRPYVIWAPDYTPSSGGVRVLHHLCHYLNTTGRKAYVTTLVRNPDYIEPYSEMIPAVVDDLIAVYPEIAIGNPLKAKVVARWVLNEPGRLGGETDYDKNEIIFPFCKLYDKWNLPEERMLYLPDLDLNLYYDTGEKRKGRVVYVGKGNNEEELEETINLPHLGNEPTKERADILRRSELMFCYDNLTAMTTAARLCGCPVCLIPDKSIEKERLLMNPDGVDGVAFGTEEIETVKDFDSAKVKERYEKNIKDFFYKLDRFVEITQNA